MRVAIYARVSSEKQVEKDLSIPAQLRALRGYALGRDWEIVEEYVDQGESARTANRPAFQEMVAAARRKERPFEAILVWKLSRFARNREDSIIYKSLLRKKGINVLSINEQVDESPAGKLLEGIIEVIDEFYSTNLAQDTLRGMRENVTRGFYNGGSVPFGYKRVKFAIGSQLKSKLEASETEAPMARQIFRLALEGKGAKEIVNTLNTSGLRNRTGHLFTTTAINSILRNETYTGALVWNRNSKSSGRKVTNSGASVVRIADSHEDLVSLEDFSRVQRMLDERRPSFSHPRTVSSAYLLSGLLRCGTCGSSMIGAPAKSGRFFYYICGNRYKKGSEGCSGSMVSKEKIEGFIVGRIADSILTEDNLKQLMALVNEELSVNKTAYAEQMDQLEAQLSQTAARLTRLYGALETGHFDLGDLAPRVKELRAQQRQLEEERSRIHQMMVESSQLQVGLDAVQGYISDLKGLLESASFIERKAFLKSFIRRIEFQLSEVKIEYTIPLPLREKSETTEEVLSFSGSGSPQSTRLELFAQHHRPKREFYSRTSQSLLPENLSSMARSAVATETVVLCTGECLHSS